MQTLRTITSNRKKTAKKTARTLEEESGILKLVHPGRRVEIHRNPISASQVMIQNPRHSVAPPQVFQNPWLVVRPDAILHPGQVFLVVPNCTIYQLLKSHRETRHFRPRDHQLVGRGRSCPGNDDSRCANGSLQEQVSSNVNGSFQEEEEIRLSSSFYYRNAQFCTGSFLGKCYGGFEREDVGMNRQVDKLKSCLRYPDSPRRLLDLRVNFAFACSKGY